MKNLRSNISACSFIGIIVLIAALTDLAFGIYYDPWYEILWFSNTILFILAFAFMFRSSLLMGAVLISSIVEIPWIVDFITHLMFGRGYFGGVTDYMFKLSSPRFYNELNHLSILPLVIYGAFAVGISGKSYLFSGMHAAVLNTLSFFFAPAASNINCINHLCFLKENPFPLNGFAYYAVATLLLCIFSYILNKAYLLIPQFRRI